MRNTLRKPSFRKQAKPTFKDAMSNPTWLAALATVLATVIASATLYVQFFRVDIALTMHVMDPIVYRVNFNQAASLQPDAPIIATDQPFIKLRTVLHNEGNRPITVSEVNFHYLSRKDGPSFFYPVTPADNQPNFPVVIPPGQTQMFQIIVPVQDNLRAILKEIGATFKTLPSGQMYSEFGLKVQSVDHKGNIYSVTSDPFVRCSFEGDRFVSAHIATQSRTFTFNLIKP
jgi:hypothetical protein